MLRIFSYCDCLFKAGSAEVIIVVVDDFAVGGDVDAFRVIPNHSEFGAV